MQASDTKLDLQRMRRGRDILLCATGYVAGAQYMIASERQLRQPAWVTLNSIGTMGWTIVGAILVSTASLLVAGIVGHKNSIVGIAHSVGAVLYLVLALAQMTSKFAPSFLILPAGLHLIEVAQFARLRGRAEVIQGGGARHRG